MIPVQKESFHPWIYSNPTKTIEKLSKQAFNYQLIEKITYLAIGAIGVGAIAAFLTTAPTGIFPYVMGGLILSTPVMACGASYLSELQKKCSLLLEEESKIQKELEQISQWTDQEITDFFQKYHIPLPSVSSLSDLLPLIARFLANYRDAIEYKELSETLLKPEDIEDRTIRFQSRVLGWQIFEETAVPAMLNAALIAEILARPTIQHQWIDLASFNIKPFAERQLDRLYGPNDDYLIFHDHQKSPLTLQEIEKNFSVDGLRELCFKTPKEIRSFS